MRRLRILAAPRSLTRTCAPSLPPTQILQAHHRLSPPVPPPGRHPFLASLPPTTVPPIKHLLFAQPPPSGEFVDFTARYGALHEDDTLTLLQKLLFVADPGDPLTGGKHGAAEARAVARKVGVEHLLDVPFVGLSNGQTRRARMAMALLRSPALLIVEEPFAGLDPEGREEVAAILGGLQDEGVRVVLVLRGGEDVPAWVTHVAEATEADGLRVGERGAERAWWEERKAVADGQALPAADGAASDAASGKEIVRLQSVDVSYGPKKVRLGRPLASLRTAADPKSALPWQVLDGISWSIKTGSRWHLQGHNGPRFSSLVERSLPHPTDTRADLPSPGSGKTTLLALILGEHPRSFSLPASSLELFSRPRRATPTPTLNALIGHTSPEIFKSFPRTVLNVAEAVGTGFEGIFSRRALSPAQTARVDELLATFWPARAPADWKLGSFAALSPADQSLVLFCRAVANEPELLVLDEPFAFMEDDQIGRARAYLRRLGGRSAVIWVGHWIEERPWAEAEGASRSLFPHSQRTPAPCPLTRAARLLSTGEFLKLSAGQVVARSDER